MWTLILAACSGDETTGDDPTDETGQGPGPTGPLEDDVPPEGAPTVEAYGWGTFRTVPDAPGGPVAGTGLLVQWLSGDAEVGFAISGLAPSTAHDAHLHALPCAFLAGGHYLLDPAAPASEANEVWLPFTTDAEGNGVAWVGMPRARGDAMSLVVHSPTDGSKLACADLSRSEVVGGTSLGSFAPYSAAEALDETIGGSATMVVTPGSTEVTLDLSGLDPASTYSAHVHALPCDVLDGGPHYERLPPVEEVLEENEIWLAPAPDASGNATATVEVDHPARSDAQAVVLHRGTPRVACADLARQDYVALATSGTALALGGSTVSGTATLSRRLDGASVVDVALDGLTPGATHPVHLHRMACSSGEGGGHTLLDPTAPEGEDNELWIPVVADDAGHARRAVGVTALVRADAQSIVVHAPDATKLACVDLTR